MIQRSAHAFPEALDDDDDDVTWALQTAGVQWKRGAHADAIEWLHRAVESAVDGGHAIRAREIQQQANGLEAALKTGWRPGMPTPAPPPPQRTVRRNPFLEDDDGADRLDPYGELAVDIDVEPTFELAKSSRIPPRRSTHPPAESVPAEEVSDDELIEEVEEFDDVDEAALAAPRPAFVSAPDVVTSARFEDEADSVFPPRSADENRTTLPPLGGSGAQPPRPPNLPPLSPSWPPPPAKRPPSLPPPPAAPAWQQQAPPVSRRPPPPAPKAPVRPPLIPRAEPVSSEPPPSRQPRSSRRPSARALALEQKIAAAKALARQRMQEQADEQEEEPTERTLEVPLPASSPPSTRPNSSYPPPDTQVSSRPPPEDFESTPPDETTERDIEGPPPVSNREQMPESEPGTSPDIADPFARPASLRPSEPTRQDFRAAQHDSERTRQDYRTAQRDSERTRQDYRAAQPDSERTRMDYRAARRDSSVPPTDSDPALPPDSTQASEPPVSARAAESSGAESVAPLSEAPVSEAPVLEVSVAEASFSMAPLSEAPLSEAPLSEAPLSQAPIAQAPMSEPPLSEPPLSEQPPSALPISAPPLSAEAAGPMPTAIQGIELGGVPGLEDLPEESQQGLVASAEIHTLAADEEVSGFGLALVLDGAVSVMPAIADVSAAQARRGELIFSQGHLEEGVPIRVVASREGATVASFSSEAFDAAVRDCPWVGDELKAVGDRLQTLAGVAMGPMGEELDDMLRGLIVDRCVVRHLLPNEVIAPAGKPVPGMVIVGAGRIELVDDERSEQAPLDELGPGSFLYAPQILQAAPAPHTARAGKDGALVLFAERKIAHELMVSVPPLLGIFAQ